MNKIQKDELGFSAIEFVMLLIIIILIGTVGYFVYKNHNQTVKDVSLTKTVKSTTTNPTTTSSSTETSLIKIPEMSIALTVPSSLSDITYHYSVNDPVGNTPVSGETFADLSTSALDSLDTGCVANSSNDTANGTALGTIVKGDGKGEQGPNFTILKQFSGYYVAYAQPQSPCPTSSGNDKEFESIYGNFLSSLPKITVTALN